MRKVGHLTSKWEKKCACCVLVGKHEKQRPLGRPMDRLSYNIKMDIEERGWRDIDVPQIFARGALL